MNGVNRVILIGNLTRDAVLKYTPQSKAVAEFGIAINEGKDRVTFLNVALWGKSAEAVIDYLKKGKKVYLEGAIKIEEWEKEGVKRQKTVVNAYSVQLLGGIDKQDQKQVVQDSADSVSW